jgi:hypothetical protein
MAFFKVFNIFLSEFWIKPHTNLIVFVACNYIKENKTVKENKKWMLEFVTRYEGKKGAKWRKKMNKKNKKINAIKLNGEVYDTTQEPRTIC